MNRNFKKYICAVLAAAMLAPISSAYAKEWVHVSSWAYNDVSNFTNEGLLPESFESISDYRKPITLQQFCELLYSLRVKTGMLIYGNPKYIDSDTPAVNEILNPNCISVDKTKLELPLMSANPSKAELKAYSDIYQGYKERYSSQVWYHSDGDMYVCTINSSEPLLREEAADIILYNAYIINKSSEISVPADITYPNSSPEAYKGIYFSLLNGIMDASENGKEFLTIEQAITVAYRIWMKIPGINEADGFGMNPTENPLIQTYTNGIEEYLLPLKYQLKKDGMILKEFESDVYRNILCIDTADRQCIAAAQTYNNMIEVYELSSGVMLSSFSGLLNGINPDCIITKSDNTKYTSFGAYIYSTNTVFEPVYSMEEIDFLRQSKTEPLKLSRREPDGWIYYSYWNDNGKMYRIDSNGENKQLLCNEDCFDTVYANGRLYFSVRGENEGRLFCIKPDGTGMEQISQGKAYIITGKLADSGESFSDAINGRIYYIEASEPFNFGYLWSVQHTDKGTLKEKISDIPLSALTRDEACIYLKNPTNGDGYILDKNGLKKLELDGSLSSLRIFGERVEGKVYSAGKGSKTICASRGSSEFTDCTHEHSYTNPYIKGSYLYEINHSLSDENYQLGTSARVNEGIWIYKRKTNEFKTDVLSEKIIARMGDLLYLNADNKIYTYNLNTGEKALIADNVLSTDTVIGSMLTFIDTDNNLCCLDLNNGTIQLCKTNGNAARYGKFAVLKQDFTTKHLMKQCSDGGYFDLTNSAAMYYGYVKY